MNAIRASREAATYHGQVAVVSWGAHARVRMISRNAEAVVVVNAQAVGSHVERTGR